MGLMLSVVLSYAGFNEALECIKHILSGVIPDTEPNFQDIVEYYTSLLQKSPNPSTPPVWTVESGQGYLHLTEDKDGRIKSAAIKFYGDKTIALLFSTKISSFGQDSVEDSQANGDYRLERYIPTKTKTIISESSESFSVGYKKRSPTTSETISDSNGPLDNSREEDELVGVQNREKLSWEYVPKSPSPTPLPEINFQSYDDDKIGDATYSESFLRSLDGIKITPLQRNDPSGRRRTFRMRRSSSSNSSKESRASREEELKMFTSLEEEEFKSMNKENNYSGFGSAPNLVTRSYSRSRSRERSKDRKTRSFNDETSPVSEERLEVRQRSLSRLGSFEENEEIKETAEKNEVTEQESEDVDFWSNIAD
ncbi:unnamed protein product [Colias eurytheme]|nr:unnamed protein product [Colias eurytheme]